jgi:hypothetical protein
LRAEDVLAGSRVRAGRRCGVSGQNQRQRQRPVSNEHGHPPGKMSEATKKQVADSPIQTGFLSSK